MIKSNRFPDLHIELIKRCKQGDRKSQFELYNLYYKAMFNASLRIVNDKMDAEDIMQDSFLKAFQNLKSYKEEVSFGAWLRRIVVNQSVDYLRKRKIEFESLEDNFEIKSEETEESWEIDDKTSVDEIITEMNKLPQGYRLVLNLYLLEGYDHDEISEILKISSSTSRSQFLRAKKRLVENINKLKHEKT